MKGKPSAKGSFSVYSDPLERLIVASRAGNVNAGNELIKTLFDIRYKVGRGISPTIVRLLDPWEFNHAFFQAYMSLIRNYRLGNTTAVRTYFSTLLKNAMIAEASSSAVFQRINCLSLDEERMGLDGETYTLIDTIEDEKSGENEVIYYTDYMDLIDRVQEEACGLTEIEKAIIRLRSEGLTYDQIAEILSITAARARGAFVRFYDLVKKTIELGSADRILKKYERLAKD